jgi:hypothetical protein
MAIFQGGVIMGFKGSGPFDFGFRIWDFRLKRPDDPNLGYGFWVLRFGGLNNPER